MSILGNTVSKKTATGEPDTSMLTPEQVVEQLRVLRKQIPEFVQTSARQMKQIGRSARVSVEFAREAINAVGASPIVQSTVGNTPEEFHQAEDEVGRWTAVESELRSLLRGVIAANAVRRHRIGLAALQVLNVSRELVRNEDHADLLPYVETMSRMPKFIRRRKESATKTANPAGPAKPAEPAKPADPVKPAQPVKPA